MVYIAHMYKFGFFCDIKKSKGVYITVGKFRIFGNE